MEKRTSFLIANFALWTTALMCLASKTSVLAHNAYRVDGALLLIVPWIIIGIPTHFLVRKRWAKIILYIVALLWTLVLLFMLGFNEAIANGARAQGGTLTYSVSEIFDLLLLSLSCW
jgi:hypothetical protein